MSTQELASFITGTDFDDFPPNVIAKAKITIRDHIGVMLATHGDRAVTAASKMAVAMGSSEEATLIDTRNKVSCGLAAMVNTIMTTSLDMDDGAYRPTGHLAHTGGVVIPSSLAVAERQNATGRSFIEAVVIGYEVALRAGWINSLQDIYTTTGMAGTYGVAAASAKLLGLNVEETANALGIAEAHCPHFSKAVSFKHMAMTKEAAGWGAMTGVTATLLAQAGFMGPNTIFDLSDYNKEPLEELGRSWEILNIYFKPYSSCRLTHAPVDGLFKLMYSHNLVYDEIEKVTVGVASLAETMINYRPSSIWKAQYSIPFVIGTALVDGEVGPKQVAEGRLNDNLILSQADKVEVVGDLEVESLRPGMCPARVKIETRDGRNFETFVPYPKGAPEDPLSEEELTYKFQNITNKVIGTDKCREITKCLDGIEDLANVDKLVDKLTAEQG